MPMDPGAEKPNFGQSPDKAHQHTPGLVIRPVRMGDRGEWLRMRLALWPHHSEEEFAGEIDAFLATPGGTSEVGAACLVAERPPGGGLCGFIELSVRGIAEGCAPGRIGYIEGWWVDADLRGHRIGGALVRAGEEWARAEGCLEMASDAELDNTASQSAHLALGYEVACRVVCFRKSLS